MIDFHTEGYASLAAEWAGQISLASCCAQARRKFDVTRKADRLHSEMALLGIGELYRVERELRERIAGDWQDLSWSE